MNLYEENCAAAEEVDYLLDWTGVIIVRNQSTDWERKSVNIESWNCSGGCCLTWVKGKERKELVRLQEIREENPEPRQPTSKYTADHKIHTETFALFPLNCWLDLRVVPIGDRVPLPRYKDIHSVLICHSQSRLHRGNLSTNVACSFATFLHLHVYLDTLIMFQRTH